MKPWISTRDGKKYLMVSGNSYEIIEESEHYTLCWASPAALTASLAMADLDQLYRGGYHVCAITSRPPTPPNYWEGRSQIMFFRTGPKSV